MMPNMQHSPRGEYLVVQAALPGKQIENIGIMLLDSGSNQLHSLFRRDFEEFAGEDADWFQCFNDEVSVQSQQLGGQQCLEWMESMLSHWAADFAKAPHCCRFRLPNDEAYLHKVYRTEGAPLPDPPAVVQPGGGGLEVYPPDGSRA
jgi:hypothetical protein